MVFKQQVDHFIHTWIDSQQQQQQKRARRKRSAMQQKNNNKKQEEREYMPNESTDQPTSKTPKPPKPSGNLTPPLQVSHFPVIKFRLKT